MGEPSPESAIIAHYERYDEARRLEDDIGPLEAARTRELVERFLPCAPSVVLDDGGAAGAYAFWLASLGYTVHLLDLVPHHIEQALEAGRRPGSPALASARVGDARRLPFDGCQMDGVLLAGPLYHLAEREERLRALAEARRVLRPGGVLLAFGVTRYAGLVYGITQGLVFDRDYLRMIRDEVRTGRRQDPPAGVLTLPNAHFHLPAELAREVADAGFTVEAVLGVLGPAWLVPDLAKAWADPARREVLLEIARLTEGEPALGPRVLVVGRRPPSSESLAEPLEALVAALRRSGSPFTIHEHAPARTFQDARGLPFDLSRLVKTIAFRTPDGAVVLAAVVGSARVDYARLAAAVGVSRRALASLSPDEVQRLLAVEPGSVSPIPLGSGVRVVVDEEVLSLAPTLYCGIGRPDRTLEIAPADLVRLTGARVAAIARPPGNR